MSRSAPVLFIHGLWLHARSWNGWVQRFEQAGYETSAPGWPGHPDSVDDAGEGPESRPDPGLEDGVAHRGGLSAGPPAKPILVGPSFGGMIAQRLLGEVLAA